MHASLEEFASQCAEQPPPDTDERFVGWEGLIVTLVSAIPGETACAGLRYKTQVRVLQQVA